MLHRAAEVHGGGELQGVEVPAALLQPVRQHVDVEVVGREGDDGHLVAELGAAFKPKKIKKASTPPLVKTWQRSKNVSLCVSMKKTQGSVLEK